MTCCARMVSPCALVISAARASQEIQGTHQLAHQHVIIKFTVVQGRRSPIAHRPNLAVNALLVKTLCALMVSPGALATSAAQAPVEIRPKPQLAHQQATTMFAGVHWRNLWTALADGDPSAATIQRFSAWKSASELH